MPDPMFPSPINPTFISHLVILFCYRQQFDANSMAIFRERFRPKGSSGL
jgi:hypothetical protein